MSVTSANVIFTLAIDGVFSTPQRMQGFSTDDVTEFEAQAIGETMMGVDGVLTGGYINVPWVQGTTFMGDSPSNDIIDTWAASMKSAQDIYTAAGLIIYPSLSKKYTLVKGYLTNYRPVAPTKKLLQPRTFQITWESAVPSPI